MAERIIDRVEAVYPGFRELIVESAVFSSDHFATMQGATGGDFTHGMIHPEQMLGGRTLWCPDPLIVRPSRTSICAARAVTRGPGSPSLPGYGCAAEVGEAIEAMQRCRMRPGS